MKQFTLLLLVTAMAAPVFSEQRGDYFALKKYRKSELPTFEKSQELIPRPILEDNPEFINMYWKCWEIGFTHLRQPQKGSPFVSNYWDEAFSPCIFQWDMIFMTHFTKYIHHIFPSIGSLDNFYVTQRKSGYICREIIEKNGKEFHYKGEANTINPPLFAWSELEWFRMTNDTARLELVLPVLEKYAEYLETGRKSSGAAHQLFWQTPLGSGMDNTPRTGSGWVDISSQMVISYNAMEKIADILDLPERAAHSRERSEEISSRINRWMWNRESGIYHDVDDSGKQSDYRTIAGFWPLLGEIPSAEQSGRMVETLLDTSSFNRTFPFASLSAEHPEFEPEGGYWRGGSWPPVSYMAVKGMDLYGYRKESYEQSMKLLTGMSEVFKESGTIWEFYAADTLTHGKLLHKRTVANKAKEAKADFIGWSALGPVALLIEDIIGISCDAPNGEIVWHMNRSDRHGIEQLNFGDNVVSLICEGKRISGRCEKPFSLKLIRRGGERIYHLKSGEFSLDLVNVAGK